MSKKPKVSKKPKAKVIEPIAVDDEVLIVAACLNLRVGVGEDWLEIQENGRLRPNTSVINSHCDGKKFKTADVLRVWSRGAAHGELPNPNRDWPEVGELEAISPEVMALAVGGNVQPDAAAVGEGSTEAEPVADPKLEEEKAETTTPEASEASEQGDLGGGEGTTGDVSATPGPEKDLDAPAGATEENGKTGKIISAPLSHTRPAGARPGLAMGRRAFTQPVNSPDAPPKDAA